MKSSPLLIDVLAPDPCDLGALIASAIAASGMPRADVVRSIATAQGRTVESVSAALSKATGRPDAGAELLRAVCVATGRRVTTARVTHRAAPVSKLDTRQTAIRHKPRKSSPSVGPGGHTAECERRSLACEEARRNGLPAPRFDGPCADKRQRTA